MNMCPFCDRKEFEHQIVHESAHYFVLYARSPLSDGHCIVIPKNHSEKRLGIPSESEAEFMQVVDQLMANLEDVYGCTGINFFANFGKTAGQEIDHPHFHVLPRYDNETESPFALLNGNTGKRRRLSPEDIQKQVEHIKQRWLWQTVSREK